MASRPEDLATTTFKTTRAADRICEDLTSKLGWKHRYVAARLAIARSLSVEDTPWASIGTEAEDMATPIRGMQLFGESVDCGAWLALITQRHGEHGMDKKTLHALVTAHWHRGAQLLHADWKQAGQEMPRFFAHLGELASLDGQSKPIVDADAAPTIAGEIKLAVGEEARDIRSDEKVLFPLNGAGGSPHMAIMGGVGSGKTRTAVQMLTSLREQAAVPLLAFDFKGDLSDSLGSAYGAAILSPPKTPIPLDVLHIGAQDDNGIKAAAARIRDSIGSVKTRNPSGIQKEALREAVYQVLRNSASGQAGDLSKIAEALQLEYEERGRKPDELSATLNELTQFDLFRPEMSPGEFFGKSWIIRLPQDTSREMRRLITNLTLDALDRWLNAQPDAPMDERGIRALRQVTLLEEAHVILETRLPALANLVRMSRSKGGVMTLVSQSPDDFEGTDDSYLDNMGLTLAFNTQARLGPARRIFGDGFSLTALPVGEAVCRIRAEARTRKVIAWTHTKTAKSETS
uniref:Helicase HerA central domain-containing protein n=1 Tax=Candidatus Kentrum sp. FM TaxID=2126340 RepID=A0A450SX46_9GAMM|nr:MAG: protein of unknown function DUF87 [Candidatus Kentron sp. FM]VFJ58599.1 MAG: protein of unknown function DUF87 [Candidatus Kentron sp. FM]VFK11142.1 MAG: protein of unknown function DUF87 [Candidatus Kentron sp. FM]